MMLDWDEIQTVFLDMDGTLLDLHFDNHFWLELVPQRFAEQNQMNLDEAKDALKPRYAAVEGTMDWYCLDYWTDELDIDIAELKREVEHLIAVHPHVTDFLSAARHIGKRVVLVTNAHQKSLSLKMERTQLAGYFDAIVCSHDYQIPKENPAFWEALQANEPFLKERTLLVDDSLSVLRSAQQYGIKYLYAVYKPDTKLPVREITEFPAIHSFQDLMPEV